MNNSRGSRLSGSAPGGEVKVGSVNGPLCPRNPKDLGKGVKQRRFARRVGTDNRRDLIREAHGKRLGAKTAEAGEVDTFYQHTRSTNKELHLPTRKL